MNIHFYLKSDKGGSETIITSFYDIQSNPFNLNDIVDLSVESLSRTQIEQTEGAKGVKDNLVNKNSEDSKNFNNKSIRIIEENKYLKIKTLSESTIEIEYHCELIEESIENICPCPNCQEKVANCACIRNICIKCHGPVGNITFTVCDDCWSN